MDRVALFLFLWVYFLVKAKHSIHKTITGID